MMELHDRRNAALQRLGPDAGERAAFFRDALLTHLELAKRDANAAAVGVGRVWMGVQGGRGSYVWMGVQGGRGSYVWMGVS